MVVMVTLISNQKKTKHFQKQLSEISADANFIKLIKHYLYRFLSVIISERQNLLVPSGANHWFRPFEEVGRGRRRHPQPRNNCVFILLEEEKSILT